MRGDLTVRSKEGQGSDFTLWLPDASTSARKAARWREEAPDRASRLLGLGDVARILDQQFDLLLESFIERLREEAIVDGVRNIGRCHLKDHLGAYVADVAIMLEAMEDARGEPNSILRHGSRIQSAIAECHGELRAELGWSANALRKEWSLLREEMERLIRRHSLGVSEETMAEAFAAIGQLVEEGAETSCRQLNKVSGRGESYTLIREQPRSQGDDVSVRR